MAQRKAPIQSHTSSSVFQLLSQLPLHCVSYKHSLFFFVSQRFTIGRILNLSEMLYAPGFMIEPPGLKAFLFSQCKSISLLFPEFIETLNWLSGHVISLPL